MVGWTKYGPTKDPDKLDDWFVKYLRKVTGGVGPVQGAIPIMEAKLGFEQLAPFKMGWEDRAKQAYFDQVRPIRKLAADSRRRELSIRTPEIALREATRLARWCGAREISEAHFERAWAWAARSRDLVLTGANERMKVKRDFAGVRRHIKNLVSDGPTMWMDIRSRSPSAAGAFDNMNIIDNAMDEMLVSGEVREIEKEEQMVRGLRKLDQRGAIARWFELGKGGRKKSK
jgi:hypothetical protein